MAVSTEAKRVPRVLGALLIAGVFIVGAYIFSSPNFSFFTPAAANAESTTALLKAYAQKDTDNDGLPDWEEALYGTDPNNAHSVSPTLSDGEAVAQGLVKPKFSTQTTASSTDEVSLAPAPTAADGSMTDQFAQNLFSQYMDQLGSSQPSDQDIDTFAQNAVESLVQNRSQQNRYSQTNVQSSIGGADALKTYAAAAQSAFNDNTISTDETGLDYFSDAIEKNQPYKLKEVAAIGTEYTTIATALIAVPTPPEAQAAQLEIANAMSKMGTDFTDMSTMSSDPLRAYLGLSSYQQDAESFAQGIADMKTVFTSEDVQFQKGEPGYGFYLTLSLGDN